MTTRQATESRNCCIIRPTYDGVFKVAVLTMLASACDIIFGFVWSFGDNVHWFGKSLLCQGIGSFLSCILLVIALVKDSPIIFLLYIAIEITAALLYLSVGTAMLIKEDPLGGASKYYGVWLVCWSFVLCCLITIVFKYRAQVIVQLSQGGSVNRSARQTRSQLQRPPRPRRSRQPLITHLPPGTYLSQGTYLPPGTYLPHGTYMIPPQGVQPHASQQTPNLLQVPVMGPSHEVLQNHSANNRHRRSRTHQADNPTAPAFSLLTQPNIPAHGFSHPIDRNLPSSGPPPLFGTGGVRAEAIPPPYTTTTDEPPPYPGVSLQRRSSF